MNESTIFYRVPYTTLTKFEFNILSLCLLNEKNIYNIKNMKLLSLCHYCRGLSGAIYQDTENYEYDEVFFCVSLSHLQAFVSFSLFS